MDRDVFLGLLALDSYNQGYAQALEGLSNTGGIGKAKIITLPDETNVQADWQSVGFYAIAYDMTGVDGFAPGATVISYRGTDGGAALDVLNGYGTGLGWPLSDQAGLAIDFARAVIGPENSPTSASNAIITGHSLGGGLGGYVSALYGWEGVLFDPMMYATAVNSFYSDVEAVVTLGGGEFVHAIERVYGNVENVAEPSFNEISGFYIPRQSEPVDVSLLASLRHSGLWNEDTVGLSALYLPDDVTLGLDLRNHLLGRRHSMSLVVIDMFGETQGSDWEKSARYFLPSLFNDGLADSIDGLQAFIGDTNPATVMRDAIAYSAIDEGTLVFGNTGIRALFDDGNNLGAALDRLPDFIDAKVLNDIGSLIVEFAGLLAINRVTPGALNDATQGILAYGTGSGGSSLTIDLSDERWELGGVLATPHQPSGKRELAQNVVDAALGSQFSLDGKDFVLSELHDWLVPPDPDSGTVPFESVDGISFSLGSELFFKAPKGDGLVILVGNDQSNSVSLDDEDSPAILLGGGGNNVMIGGEGADALIGGDDDDELSGGDGNDWFFSGKGQNTIDGGDQFDIAVYSDTGHVKINYDITEAEEPLSIKGNDQDDTLKSVEHIKVLAPFVTFDLKGIIGPEADLDESLIIESIDDGQLGPTVKQLISGSGLEHGIGVSLLPDDDGNEKGVDQIFNPETGWTIQLRNFNTEIVATEYDDDIFDGSEEDKVLSSGAGNDKVSVEDTDAQAVIFGGEGADELTGGNLDDFIIDFGNVQDALTEVTVVEWGEGTNLYYGYGAVNAGAGDDVIVVGRDGEFVRELGATTFGSVGSGIYIDAGTGNDTVNLVGGLGSYYYKYEDGDGYDLVLTNSKVEKAPDSNFLTRMVEAPEIAFDLTDFNSSEIKASFEVSRVYQLEEGVEDLRGIDGDYVYEISGTLRISVGGGSIVLNECIFNYAGEIDDLISTTPVDVLDLTQSDVQLLFDAPWKIETADDKPVNLEFIGGPAPMMASMQAAAFAAPALALPPANDPVTTATQTDPLPVFLAPGEQSYIGGTGVDRLFVTWDLYALGSTLSGNQLIIEDRWGLVGSTTVTDFDEIYVVSQDQTYSPEEFHEMLGSQANGETLYSSDAGEVISGTPQRDRLFGRGGDDTLNGLGGDDVLDGGSGADTLTGGDGDDIYVVDDASDLIIENVAEGDDLVRAGIDYTLGDNVERLELLDGAAQGTGNTLDNRITGNGAANTLDGLGGNDYLLGLDGDDTLLGGDGRDQLIGGAGDDTLDGGDGNDTLIGGVGADSMIGGSGDDVYYVDDLGDTVSELAEGGTDMVHTRLDGYVAPDNVEKILLGEDVLAAFSNGSGTQIIGNSLDNTLSGDVGQDRLLGKDGDDQLFGDAGNDYLDAGSGANLVEGGDGDDTIIAGAGDDELFGDNGDDLIRAGSGANYVEGGAGNDVIHGGNAATDWDADNPQYDTLIGDAGDDAIYGYAGDDELDGGDGDDVLDGGEGWDYLFGEAGNDILLGGGGGDYFFAGVGNDLIVGDGTASLADIGAFVSSSSPGYADTDEDILFYEGSREDVVVTALGNRWFRIESSVAGVSDVDHVVNVELLAFDSFDPDTGEYLGTEFIPLLAEDEPFSLDAAAFVFAPEGEAVDYTLELANGDAAPTWVSIVDGRITGTPPQDFFGDLSLVLSGSSSSGWSNSVPLTLDILPVNDAPVAEGQLGDVEFEPGQTISFGISPDAFSDVDGDALNLTARLAGDAALPAWLDFDGTQFTGTAPQDFTGALAIEVVASDGMLFASEAFRLTVAPPNSAPAVVAPLPDLTSTEDQAIDLPLPTAGITDVDGDVLTFTLEQGDGTALPDWLSFDGSRITGMPPQDFNGLLSLRMRASDGEFEVSDPFDFTIVAVNDAPQVLVPLADATSPEDAVFSYTIDPSTFGDVDGDSLTLAARLGDGSDLPDWLSFDGTTLTGRPPQDFNGTFEIEITATDGELVAASTFTVVVDPINDAPVLMAPLADVSAQGDAAIDFSIPADAFADVDGDALSFAATLSDGSALPSWLVFDGATQSFTGLAPSSDTQIDVRVTASDGELVVSDNFAVVVEGTEAGDSAGFSFHSLESWYDPAYGGGYNVTYQYTVQPEAIADGELKAWEIISAYTGPGVVTGGWVNGFPGEVGVTFDPDEAVFTNEGQVYQPELDEGQSFQVTVQVNGAPYNESEFAFAIFDRDPALNLADDGDTAVALQPAQHWSGGFTQNIDLSNTSAVRIDDWQMVLDIPDGIALSVTSVWGATATVLVTGDVLFEAVASNEEIAAGGQASFGFSANYSGVASLQLDNSSFTLTDADARQFDVVLAALGASATGLTWTYGTNTPDVITGLDQQANRIFGGVGDDELTGGDLADWIAGGSGDDVLVGLAGNDVFFGGHGNDQLFGGSGTDTARMLGYSSSYELVTQGGTLGMQVRDLGAIAHGDDGTDQLSSIEQLVFKDGETLNIASPIILDLAGDGIVTLSAAESNARFDLDSDGLDDDTSWIGAGDGFLYLDRDGNGTMSGVEEISFIDDVEGAASDLAGLVAFDSNGDGELSASDQHFAEFGVWRDLDGDGIVDRGETASLSAMGIASIGLVGEAVEGTVELGSVAVLNNGTYTLTSGETRAFADAALTYFSASNHVERPINAAGHARGSWTDLELRDMFGFLNETSRLTMSVRNAVRARAGGEIIGFLEAVQVRRDFAAVNGRDSVRVYDQEGPFGLDRPFARSPVSAKERVEGLAGNDPLYPSTSRSTQDLPLRREAAWETLEGFGVLPPARMDSDMVNRLALMRQDMSTFGTREALENHDLGLAPAEPRDWYA